MTTDADSPVWYGLLLDPLDVLFFRDGRPFDAANRVVSGSATPQTLAGAIRTALLTSSGFSLSRIHSHQGAVVDRLREAGADEAILSAEFRGPWFARKDPSADGPIYAPVFPCPMNLRQAKMGRETWLIGRPRDTNANPLPGWNHWDGLWPIEYGGIPDPKSEPVMLTLAGLKKYLSSPGDQRDLSLDNQFDYVSREDLVATDHRVGIGINPSSLTTIDGELYGIGLMVLAPGVKIRMEVRLPHRLAEQLDGLAVPLGGEGRCVQVSVAPACDFPKFDSGRSACVWYVATPTFLSDQKTCHRPLPKLQHGRLRAATSDRGQAVSGWNVARGGPRGTRFFVPAGAVYFLEGAGREDDFMEESDQKLALLQEGWGFAIQGTWS